MNQEQAIQIARKIWGPRAYALVRRQFMLGDQAGPDGYVVTTGPVTGYRVGYRRKSKYYGTYGLWTEKGSSPESFEAAFANALAEMTARGERKASALAEALS